MTDPTPDNRRGFLSADQHVRLRNLPRSASWWTRYVRALGPGTNLTQLVAQAPQQLDADLADGRVIGADATLSFEPLAGLAPQTFAWVVRLDDGQLLTLAPGVWLPPGRQRIYFLPRSRWVVHGEAGPEQWDDYRALVLRTQACEPARLEALRAGQLPPAMRPALRAHVRKWWILVLLALVCLAGVVADGTSGIEVQLASGLFFALLGLWAALRIARAYGDASRGKVRASEGPLAIELAITRQGPIYTLAVGGERVRLTDSDRVGALVPTLHEGMPCRLFLAPTSGLFIAIEPLFTTTRLPMRG